MKQVLALLTFAAAVLFALGPVLVPDFGGFDPALYPIPQENPPVQPAGYAFAIWGVIYLWLVISTGFGLFKRRDAADWAPARVPLLVALVVGSAWLPVALVSPIGAEVLILLMLVTALIAMDRAPYALFAGWLTAASFAGLGLIGAGYGLLFGQVGWAWIAVVLALGTALIGHRLRPNAIFYPLGVAWALVAIAVQNAGAVWSLTLGALLAALFLALLAARAYQRHRRGDVV